MPDISVDQLKSIKTFQSLVKFLRDELDWPIGPDSFTELDEISYEYSTEELGLQEKFASKIRKIRQLRPVSGQPWGVFWVDFEPKHLPIGALRKILNYFVHKQRARTGDRATWAMDDLLFIAGTGEGGHRGTTFAHFHKDDEGREELKEFSWDEAETHFYYILDYVERLKWPQEIDADQWRNQWRSAFKGSTRKAIKTAEQLAVYMAELARDMRKRVNEAFEVESEKGPLHEMLNMFKKVLIHDLEKDAFADMYAQTVTYGLFSARCMDTDGHFELYEVVDRIPETNPFLKGLFKECFKAAKKSHDSLNFDELGVMRLVELLDDLNQKDGSDRMQDILREFGRQTRGEDPVIHFYEGFLNAYESTERKRRGVYYTPDPVVSYIVRSVDEILRKEFRLELGLADTSTWGDLVAKGVIARPEGMHQNSKEWKTLSKQLFVQILDPATGTGTFLKHAILLIYKTMTEKWQKEGCLKEKIDQLWNDYVPTYLLPRVFGFELMMAPYAVCHMKLGLVLKETGYKFKEDQRLQVYLTNTLEPPNREAGLPLFDAYIADEVRSANEAKSSNRFTVVIGNPPYSSFGQMNRGERILNLLKDYKKDLKEKKINLDDDFIKFIRFSHWTIEEAGQGISAMITSNTFIDGITHRQMRRSLMDAFGKIYIYNLHGSYRKGEITPDGGKDENVFDIQQGVSINIFVKHPQKQNNSVVKYRDLWGSRVYKFEILLDEDLKKTKWEAISPKAASWFFIDKDSRLEEEYSLYVSMQDIFPQNSVGILTSRDEFVIDDNKNSLERRIRDFYDLSISDQKLCDKYKIKDNISVSLSLGRRQSKFNANLLMRYNYRQFDKKYIYFSRYLIHRTREDTQKHLLHENISLISCRQEVGLPFCHAFCVAGLVDDSCLSNKSRERGYIFPLYLYSGSTQLDLLGQEGRMPNLSRNFIKTFAEMIGLQFTSKRKDDLEKTFGAQAIFYYVYAILHSLTYRSRYAEQLKIDFPRLPLIRNLELFRMLVKLGSELVALHLMESPESDKFITKYAGSKNSEVEKVAWVDETVWIDKDQSVGFKGVPEAVWNFHIGGYQVCEKWLKDRKGRVLSKEDIEHYQKIIVALSETIRIMAEIDKVIDVNGGWPGAFEKKAG